MLTRRVRRGIVASEASRSLLLYYIIIGSIHSTRPCSCRSAGGAGRISDISSADSASRPLGTSAAGWEAGRGRSLVSHCRALDHSRSFSLLPTASLSVRCLWTTLPPIQSSNLRSNVNTYTTTKSPKIQPAHYRYSPPRDPPSPLLYCSTALHLVHHILRKHHLIPLAHPLNRRPRLGAPKQSRRLHPLIDHRQELGELNHALRVEMRREDCVEAGPEQVQSGV